MAVRLRYLAHDLEVPAGQFVIGRSPECQLSLDDPLVSRRHAILTVLADSASIEDLGSRNGVLVNGARIEGTRVLVNGDKIVIGTQEIAISYAAESQPSSTKRIDTRTRLQTLAGPHAAELETNAASAPAPPSGGSIEEAAVAAASMAAMTPNELQIDVEEDSATYTTSPSTGKVRQPDKRISALALIGGLADKALAMGRAEEAERLLMRSLSEVLEKARDGSAEPSVTERAARYAVKLADAMNDGSWVDYVFHLYTVLGALLPAHVVDELYEVVRKVKIDRSMLRAYTEMLRSQTPRYGPGERFVQQRIEGLERLGALK